MRKHFLQMLSLILVLVLVVSLIPAVYATEAASQAEPTEEVTTPPTETEPELSPEILESRQIPAQYTGMEDYIPGFDDDGPTLFSLSST